MPLPYRDPGNPYVLSPIFMRRIQLLVIVGCVFILPLLGLRLVVSTICDLLKIDEMNNASTICHEKIQVIDIRETGFCPRGTYASVYNNLSSRSFVLVCECPHDIDAGYYDVLHR